MRLSLLRLQTVAADNNVSNLPLGSIPLTGFVPQSVITDGTIISNLPLGIFPLTGLIPTASVNVSPSTIIDLTALSLEESRYPLSSASGRHIPLDVLGPIGLHTQAITTSPMTAVITVPLYSHVLYEIVSTVDAVLAFSDTIVDLITENGQYILQANRTVVLIPTHSSFSLISLTGSGTVYINILRKWNTLAITTDRD